jgi:hypothetical protein
MELLIELMNPEGLTGGPCQCPQDELYSLIFVTLSAYDRQVVKT